MRVTHLITRLIVGGAQENTVASVLGLREKPDLQIHLISGPTFGPEGSLEPRVSGIPGLLTVVPSLVRPVHPWKDCQALNALTGLLRAQKPDLVHTHSGKAGFLGRLAARRAGVPIIVHHIHGPSFGPFQGPLANGVFTLAERIAGRLTTHFVCSASAMAGLYLKAGIGRTDQYTRIFSGFPLEPYLAARNDSALRARLGLSPGDFVIGKIARLAPLKGHRDLLAALAALKPAHPNARLLFVGDGALRGELEEHARNLGLTQQVIFTGLVPPGDVASYVGIMDCLAHLSYREALSRALPQALAARKPVIAYDFDGADEICLDGQTGFLVRTGDVGAVTERLTRLMASPDLCGRLGGAGQKMVQEYFPVERLVNDQYALYLKLASERNKI